MVARRNFVDSRNATNIVGITIGYTSAGKCIIHFGIALIFKATRGPTVQRQHINKHSGYTLTSPQTYLLDELLRDRVEARLVRSKRLDGLPLVDLTRAAEDRPAELHAALDDTCAVVADDPLKRVIRERARGLRRRVEQRDLVEAQTYLGVGRVREVVHLAEELDVRGREGGVGLKTLQEDNLLVGAEILHIRFMEVESRKVCRPCLVPLLTAICR